MDGKEIATLGGGCFWCLEAIYQRLKGVEKVVSGYSGGYVERPTTEMVYKGKTGHAEVVQVTFDPKTITYKQLLEIFFVMHDPTTLNRQGNDVGDEYRSIILYSNKDQKRIAQEMIKDFAPTIWKDPIVTELKPLVKFWPAGKEHQNFYNNNPGVGYCQVIIEPKIAKLRSKFLSELKPT
ncbi:MAG TPA: peptide-methionine (S)-S-oxide reductase MsrA [Candidatus Sulfotelmatobacter sp.]|nr:peptide-methionine (S)-S-oxide reductase MsrA [Candidatus Sulfotelmatobacter sp.]